MKKRFIYQLKRWFHNLDSIEEVNKYLEERLKILNSKTRPCFQGKLPKEILEEEKSYLLPLKSRQDVSRIAELKVNKYST